MRRPEPYSKRQHGGIARQNPWFAFFACPDTQHRRADAARAAAIGFGKGLRDLRRPHRHERSNFALAVTLQKAREGSQPRQRAHQRAPADAVRPARGHESPDILRRDFLKPRQVNAPALMIGEEGQKLQHVPLVGLNGLERHPPLGRKLRQPARHFGVVEIRRSRTVDPASYRFPPCASGACLSM